MKGVLVLVFSCVAHWAFAQDVHWTQFNDNPIYQNPGQAGHFDEDLRFCANYRTQWKSVSVPFQTTALSFDGRFKGIGLATNLFHDQVGDGKFQTLEWQLSASKTLAITQQHLLSVGLQAGLNYRQLNSAALTFDAQYNGFVFDPTAPTNEYFQTASMCKPMLGFGLIHRYQLLPDLQLESGLGLFNLTRPDQSFYGNPLHRDVRVNLYSKLSIPLIDGWKLQPSLQYAVQGKYRELQLGALANYCFSRPDHIYLFAGAWWRSADAFCLNFGYQRGSIYTGISYDINYSSLVPASHSRGAFELSFRYVIRRFHPPTLIHRVCPDYI
ncbi:MAG: hypothetical protein RLZZ301_1260 [Bacteroidota bacterium]|jgi:type IX secretion system PorP/SprF family membrane protein